MSGTEFSKLNDIEEQLINPVIEKDGVKLPVRWEEDNDGKAVLAVYDSHPWAYNGEFNAINTKEANKTDFELLNDLTIPPGEVKTVIEFPVSDFKAIRMSYLMSNVRSHKVEVSASWEQGNYGSGRRLYDSVPVDFNEDENNTLRGFWSKDVNLHGEYFRISVRNNHETDEIQIRSFHVKKYT